jgi:excisionase family DNA binding protein
VSTPVSLDRGDVLTVAEVSELLRSPKSTVEELARRGELPSFKVGRRRLFSRAHLEAHVANLLDARVAS